jgi:hypothetical protein
MVGGAIIAILVCSALLAPDACVEETAFSVTRAPVVEGMLCEISAPQFNRCGRASQP